MIGKALIQKPRLVIFDEPTRGVDVGAIAEIHQIINRLADEGLAVVVISSYLPEIMNLSDRILVCRQGRIVEEITPTRGDRRKNHVRSGALNLEFLVHWNLQRRDNAVGLHGHANDCQKFFVLCRLSCPWRGPQLCANARNRSSR